MRRPTWTTFEMWLDNVDIPRWQELRRSERLAAYVAVVLTLLILFVLIWLVIRPADAADRVNTVQIMVAIVGGTVVAIGSYVAWRNLRLNQETLRATQDRQITERFTRAIDQLGATHDNGKPHLELRLGGIYALERIARDAANDPRGTTSDYWTVFEVLAAYVRQNAPWPPDPLPSSAPGVTENATEPGTLSPVGPRRIAIQEKATIIEGAPLPTVRPRIDIQEAMTVIGRRAHRYGLGEDQRLDLRGTDLRGAFLESAHLEGAFLGAANLEDVQLGSAHLSDASFWGANLKRAKLGGALQGAHFSDADLEDAHLGGACLTGANFAGAHLTRTSFWGADLEGAHFEQAYLEEVNFWGVDLRTTRGLTWEQLQSAHIDERTLHNLQPPSSTESDDDQAMDDMER